MTIGRRFLLTTAEPTFYSLSVEVSTPSTLASQKPGNSLSRVARLVREELTQVEGRIAQQASAFDPAIEGYISYAIGSQGKRLRPLVALLSGGALGRGTPEHLELA